MTVIDSDRKNRPLPNEPEQPRGGSSSLRSRIRYLPLAIILLGLAAGYAAGLQHYLSLDALAARRNDLIAFVDVHRIGAAALYLAGYAAAVAFSFPCASVLTIFGGFLFGWLQGGILTAVAATLGATALFLAARTAFGDLLRRRAGPALQKLAHGFERDAFNYLLVLRLAPVFPFFVVNLAPAFLGVRLRTFFAATLLGILPGTFVYAYLGQGLDSLFLSAAAAGHGLTPADLATPKIVGALALLALMAAIPLAVRRLHRS